MIERMASDLGVFQFKSEEMTEYRCRVMYSAIACWIKTVALDKTVVSRDASVQGASRRHIYDRCRSILNAMIMMFPDTGKWFEPLINEENPVNIIRSRLINHGDLLNAGFETNLALAASYTESLTNEVEVVYGELLNTNMSYSGISSIRYSNSSVSMESIVGVKEWFSSFLKEIWWSDRFTSLEGLQYFNPSSPVRNNYSAWQERGDGIKNDVVLARQPMSNNRYCYYLMKADGKLIHKLDPFLQDQLYHVRIMYALRSLSSNRLSILVKRDNDYVRVKLNAILPQKEQLLMESYAWPVNNIYDKLEWIMNPLIWDYIEPFIKALDVEIEEKQNG